VPLGQNFGLLLALAAIGSMGSAIAVSAASAMVVEEGRKYGMGFSIALFSMSQSVGMVLGPILGGTVIDFVGI